MINIVKNWRVALFIFYICMIAPTAWACNATLDMSKELGFYPRATLGSASQYTQRVYSGDAASFSTITFPKDVKFDKKTLLHNSAKNMVEAVSSKTGISKPVVNLLDANVLPRVDRRLEFLGYIQHPSQGGVTVEVVAALRSWACWTVLRFTDTKNNQKEEGLESFALLTKNTVLTN
jgi:hypothetical protein